MSNRSIVILLALLVLVLSCSFAFAVDDSLTDTAADPQPEIKAKGLDGPLTIGSGTPLGISVSLDAGVRAGEDADWWLVADTP